MPSIFTIDKNVFSSAGIPEALSAAPAVTAVTASAPYTPVGPALRVKYHRWSLPEPALDHLARRDCARVAGAWVRHVLRTSSSTWPGNLASSLSTSPIFDSSRTRCVPSKPISPSIPARAYKRSARLTAIAIGGPDRVNDSRKSTLRANRLSVCVVCVERDGARTRQRERESRRPCAAGVSPTRITAECLSIIAPMRVFDSASESPTTCPLRTCHSHKKEHPHVIGA